METDREVHDMGTVRCATGVLKYVCDIVVKKFTFAISSPDEFLFSLRCHKR